MSRTLADLLAERREIETAINQAIAREYPIGGAVVWMRGDNRCYGTVVGHDYGDRVRVQNDLTKATYWIDISDIVRAWKKAAA